MSSRGFELLVQNIQKLMKTRGVYARQVAAGAQMNASLLSRFLKMRGNPTLETIENIAQFFEIPLSKLFADEKEQRGLTNEELLNLLSERLDEQLQLTPNQEKIFRILEQYDDDQLKDVLKKIKNGGKHAD